MKLDRAFRTKRAVGQLVLGSIGLAVVTFVGVRLGADVDMAVSAYLILIALLSAIGSFAASVILSFAAVVCLSYFFAPPQFSFHIGSPEDVLAITAFLTTSLIITGLTAKLRKTAEQALATQKALIDTVPTPLWTALPDGSRDFVSQPWLEYTGLSHAEAVGSGWTSIYHPEDRARVSEKWRNAVTTGESFQFEGRVRNAAGAYRWCLTQAAPSRDKNGTIIKWYGSSVDIEDRHRAAHELRESERQWRAVFEHNPVMYFMVDSAGTVLSVNSFGATQLGYAVDELIGQSVLNVFFEEDREVVQRHINVCLENLGRAQSWEIRKVRKGGAVLWVRENAKAVRRSDNQVIVLVACEDITERKQTEEALKLSEAFMAHAQQLAGVGSWAYKNSHTNKYWDVAEHWSPQMWRIADFDPSKGFPPTELIFSRIHPEDRQRMMEANAQVISEGRPLNIQYRYFRADGQIRVLHSIGTLIFQDGIATRFVGATLDITEREQRIEALRRSELSLAEGERLAHLGSWSFDPSGNFDYWSEELFRIYGLDPTEGSPSLERYLQAVHPEDQEFMSQLIQGMLAQGSGCDVTKRIVRTDGEVRYIRCVGVPVLDGGVLKSIFGTALDVTEQAHLTQELQRREAYLAEAQRLSHTGSFGWTPATGETIWSEETFRIFDCDPTTKPTLKLVLQRTHPEDRTLVQQFIERVSDDGKDWDLEHRLLTPDSKVKHVHVVAHATRDPTGKFAFVGAVMDITERKRAEAALRDMQMELSHANRVATTGQLTASITHEVNQPITAAVTYALAARRWLSAEPPNFREVDNALSLIVKEGNRAGEVVGRIRALIKKEPARKDAVAINDAILEIIALTRAEAANNSVSVRTQLAEGLPRVQGDRVQLQQVLLNLIINAIEAMRDVGEEERELLISTRNEPDGVSVEVRDSGPGFAPAALDRVFEAFYTTKPGGLGLGLSICRSIIEAHHGRLSASPNVPRGAIFRFIAPAHPAAAS